MLLTATTAPGCPVPVLDADYCQYSRPSVECDTVSRKCKRNEICCMSNCGGTTCINR